MLRPSAPPNKAKKLGNNKKNIKGQPTVEEFLIKRDYTGALTLLEFKLKCQDGEISDLLQWIGYCAFHLGNFRRAENAYKELIDVHNASEEFNLYLSCCYFYQQMYDEALKSAEAGPKSNPLQNRLLFNIYHRLGDEKRLLQQHQNLKDTKEDQLSLAAVHFLRSHFQEVRIFAKYKQYYLHIIIVICMHYLVTTNQNIISYYYSFKKSKLYNTYSHIYNYLYSLYF